MAPYKWPSNPSNLVLVDAAIKPLCKCKGDQQDGNLHLKRVRVAGFGCESQAVGQECVAGWHGTHLFVFVSIRLGKLGAQVIDEVPDGRAPWEAIVAEPSLHHRKCAIRNPMV